MTTWRRKFWNSDLGVRSLVKPGKRVKIVIEGQVERYIHDHGIQFTNGTGTSHTVYLNQDDIVEFYVAEQDLLEPKGLGAVVYVPGRGRFVKTGAEGWWCAEHSVNLRYTWKELLKMGWIDILSSGLED